MRAWVTSSLAVGVLVCSACKTRQRAEQHDAPPSPQASGRMERPPSAEAIQSVVLSGPEAIRKGMALGRRGFLINVWASWCGPCKSEFPMLAKQQAILREEGLELLFVSVDEEETRSQAAAFAARYGVRGPLWVAERPLGEFKTALNPRWPGMLPATFLYDDAGRLRYYWGGEVFEEELRKVVDGFLRGEKIDGEQVEGLAPGLDAREDP